MLTVDQLRQKQLERANINHETYKRLYAMCTKRIQDLAAHNITSCVWVVPPFYPGRPLYTVTHAMRYVRDKLRHGGFSVTADPLNNALNIDWDASRQPPPRKKKKKNKTKKTKKTRVLSLTDKAALAERLTGSLLRH